MIAGEFLVLYEHIVIALIYLQNDVASLIAGEYLQVATPPLIVVNNFARGAPEHSQLWPIKVEEVVRTVRMTSVMRRKHEGARPLRLGIVAHDVVPRGILRITREDHAVATAQVFDNV